MDSKLASGASARKKVDAGFTDDLGSFLGKKRRRFAQNRVIAQREARVGLGVQVYDQHPQASLGKVERQVGDQRGLADPTLLVGDDEGFHKSFFFRACG